MADATDELLEYLRDPRNWEKAGGGAARPTPSPPDEIDQILEWMKDPQNWVDVEALPAEPEVAVPAQPSPPPIPQVPPAGEVRSTPPGRPIAGPLAPTPGAAPIPRLPVVGQPATIAPPVAAPLAPAPTPEVLAPPPGAPGVAGALLRAEKRFEPVEPGLTIRETRPPLAPSPEEEERSFAAELYRNMLAGTAGLGAAVGTGLEMLGAERTGAEVQRFWKTYERQYETRFDESVLDDPSLLVNPRWLGINVARFAPSVAASLIGGGAVGGALRIGSRIVPWSPQVAAKLAALGARAVPLGAGATGGALEATGLYEELTRQGADPNQARAIAGFYGLISAGLNAASFDVLFNNPAGRRWLTRALFAGAAESVTEQLEEPAQEIAVALGGDRTLLRNPRAVIEAMLTVSTPSFVLGGLAGAIKDGGPAAKRLAERILGVAHKSGLTREEALRAIDEAFAEARIAGAEAEALREELAPGARPAEPTPAPEAPPAAAPTAPVTPPAAVTPPPVQAAPPAAAPVEAPPRAAPRERPRPLSFAEFAAAQGRPGINAAEPGFLELRRAYDNLQAPTFAVKPRAKIGVGGFDVTGYQVVRIEDGSPVGEPYLSGAAAQLRANRMNAEAVQERIRAIREPIPTIRLERRPEPEVAPLPTAVPPGRPAPPPTPPAPPAVAVPSGPIAPTPTGLEGRFAEAEEGMRRAREAATRLEEGARRPVTEGLAPPQVPGRPALEPEPVRPEEPRINVPEAEDFLSRMRTEGPGGEIRAGAAFDPRIVKVLGNTLYSGDLGQITVKEMIQNAVDSIRGVPGGTGRVSVNVDSASRTFRVDDTGTGMTLAVATKEFLDPGASLKPPEASGGLGIAKVAILGNAERIGLATTALDPERSVLVTTRLTGSGGDWLTQNLRVESGPAEVGARTGTSLEIQLGPEARFAPDKVLSWLRGFLELQRLQGQEFDFTYDGKSIAAATYQAPLMAMAVPIPGGTMDIYQGGQVGLRGFVKAEVLNRGLPQFSTMIYLPREVEVPWRILVDVAATGSPEQGEYPFRPDREGLRDVARLALDNWVRANLFEVGAERERETYRTMWENAPRIPGTPGHRVVDTANKIPPEVTAEIAARPYLTVLSRALFDSTARIQAAFAPRDAKYAHGDYGAIGLGGDYLGVNVPGKFLGLAPTARVILVNLYRVAQEIREGVNAGLVEPAIAQDQLAEQLAATILHELTHNVHPGHESDFVGELTRNIGRAAIQHRMAVNGLRRALKGNAYANILADLDRISGYWGGEDLFGKIAGGDAEVGERPGRERPARLGPEGGARPGEAVPVGLPSAPEGLEPGPAPGERARAPGEPGAPGVRGPAPVPERGGEPGAAPARGALAAPIEVGIAAQEPLPFTGPDLERAPRRLYHGTAGPAFMGFSPGVVYLTADPQEASMFASDPILNRGGANPRILEIKASRGRVKDIDAVVQRVIMDDADLDAAISAEASTARDAGYRYLTFRHPPGFGDEDFAAVVSLFPESDLSIRRVAGAVRGQIPPRAEEPKSAEQAPGIRPPSEVGIPRRRGAGVRLVGLGISPEARAARADFVEYRGKRARNARDVARLLQPTRDPRWETFRIVYVDDAGNARAVEAVSSRHVTSTFPFLDMRGWNLIAIGHALTTGDERAAPPAIWKMRQRMARLGATGYWLSHNHPTGRPKPSADDKSLSRTFSRLLPGFRGHVIINAGSYGLIRIAPDGTPTEEIRVFPTDDRILEPSIPHPILGRLIVNPADLALAIPDIVRPEGYLSMLYLGSDGRVRAVEEIPVGLFLAPRRGRDWPMADYIRGAKAAYGAQMAIAYSDRPARDVKEAGDRLVDSNLLTAFQYPGRGGLIEGPAAAVQVSEAGRPFRVQEPEGGEFQAEPGPTEEFRPRRLTERDIGLLAREPEGGYTSGESGRRLDLWTRLVDYAAWARGQEGGEREAWEARMRRDLGEAAAPHLDALWAEVSREEEATPAPETPPGAPTADPLSEDPSRAVNVNLDRLITVEAVKDEIRQVGRLYREQIQAQRRRTITFDQLRRLADETGIDAARLNAVRIGEAWAPEDLLAARRIFVASAQNLHGLHVATAAGGSDEDMAKFAAAFQKHVGIQKAVSGLTAEAARALGQQRIGASATAEAYRRLIDSLGGREVTQEIAERIGRMDPGRVLQLNQFVRHAIQPRFKDKIFEVWINALLSGPRTHGVNVTSNFLFNLERGLVERTAAGAIDWARAAATGTRQERFIGEGRAEAYGLMRGLAEGAHAFAESWRTEMPVFGREREPFLAHPPAIGGKVGAVVRTPTRLLRAEDEFSKAVGYRMALQALAYRRAASEGLVGQAFARRLTALAQEPDEALIAEAQQEARVRTFTDEGSKFARALIRLRDTPIFGMRPLKYIIPFVSTPERIFVRGIERTPLGWVLIAVKQARGIAEERAAAREGREPEFGRLRGGELSDEVAKAAVGSLLSAGMVAMVWAGMATGGGPGDPADKQPLYATGWQPYAFRLADIFFAYGRLEPFGLVLGTVGDFLEGLDERQKMQNDEAATRVVNAVIENFQNKSFLTGLRDASRAWIDPERYGQWWLQGLASTVVPQIAAQTVPLFDPTARRARTTGQAILARIPGLSRLVPPLRDIWGQPVTRTGLERASRFISPVTISEAKDDPAALELVRLGVRLGRPARDFEGIRLTDEEHERYSEALGRVRKEKLSEVIRRGSYVNAVDDQWRMDRIADAIRDAGTIARDRFRRTIPFGERTRRKEERKMQRLQPPVRRRIEEQHERRRERVGAE